MNISPNDAVSLLSSWRDDQTLVRAIHAMKNGGMAIVGQVADVAEGAVDIPGEGCELLLDLRVVCVFDTKSRGKHRHEVDEETKKEYPTLIEVTFSNGDRTGVLEFTP